MCKYCGRSNNNEPNEVPTDCSTYPTSEHMRRRWGNARSPTFMMAAGSGRRNGRKLTQKKRSHDTEFLAPLAWGHVMARPCCATKHQDTERRQYLNEAIHSTANISRKFNVDDRAKLINSNFHASAAAAGCESTSFWSVLIRFNVDLLCNGDSSWRRGDVGQTGAITSCKYRDTEWSRERDILRRTIKRCGEETSHSLSHLIWSYVIRPLAVIKLLVTFDFEWRRSHVATDIARTFWILSIMK